MFAVYFWAGVSFITRGTSAIQLIQLRLEALPLLMWCEIAHRMGLVSR